MPKPINYSPKTARAIPTDATISATQIAATSKHYQWLDLNSIMKAASEKTMVY